MLLKGKNRKRVKQIELPVARGEQHALKFREMVKNWHLQAIRFVRINSAITQAVKTLVYLTHFEQNSGLQSLTRKIHRNFPPKGPTICKILIINGLQLLS